MINKIFPIAKEELGKFLCLSLMIFGILYSHATLKSIKDSIIVPNLGAQALSFIDLYLVLPSSLGFAVLYAKLVEKVDLERLFIYIILCFLLLVVLFIFIIYPIGVHIHPDPYYIKELQELYPNLYWPLMIYSKWSYAIFAIIVDLWGPVILVLLFWQTTNFVCNSDEARRFYPLLGIMGNISLIIAGSVISKISAAGYNYAINNTIMIIFAIAIVLAAFRLLSVKFSPKPLSEIQLKIEKESVLENLKHIFSSKYLMLIMVLVVSYGAINNMIEVTWKTELRKVYSSEHEYAAFMGIFTKYIGIATICIMLFSHFITRIFSWRSAALITPIVILISSNIFIFSIVNKLVITKYLSEFGISFEEFIAIWGAAQMIIIKSCKYSLFDPTKEILFINAKDDHIKTKGKAAIYVIGIRLSDSIGAFIISSVLFIFPRISHANFLTIIAGFVTIIVMLWIISIFRINSRG